MFMLIGGSSNKTVAKNSKEQSIQSEANHVYPKAKAPHSCEALFWRLVATYDSIYIDIIKTNHRD